MIWLKECPRCQGDLILDQDHYGKFKTCVQCGYLRDVVATEGNPGTVAVGTSGAGRVQPAARPLAA